MRELLSPDLVGRLRAALVRVEYTVGAIEGLLGEPAHQALHRNETTAALRRTRGADALSTLTRLWPLQVPVPRGAAEQALPGGIVEALCAAGVLECSGGEVRARLDIRPYADDNRDWWVVSDLTPGLDGRRFQMSTDHVLGVSSASTSLAQLTIRRQVGSALDLGTGGGVQALHLSEHAERVVATDLNPRCLEMADLTACLNEVDLDLRLGDLFEPVADESFDLIVTNPPFVISPGAGERLVYRDSGLPGDELVRTVVTSGVEHLRPGGWCEVLANWAHYDGQPWDERVASWVRGTGCDVWVVQRDVSDITQYVELWLQDAGLHGADGYTAAYDAWLQWFEEQQITAVGFGWLAIRNSGRDHPVVRLEEWPYDVEQPLGAHIAEWGERVEWLPDCSDEALLGSRLSREPDVVEERIGTPGDADPARIVVRSQRGMRRARQVTTAVAAFVGACDGDLTVGQIGDALATLLDAEASSVCEELVTAARSLLEEGFLSHR
ncbi:MAG: DUF7059 domain-containing protein [Nocardioidaceae bacterium]